ncbi:MAG: hypothetical protein JSW33_01930, partial [bacterium]
SEEARRKKWYPKGIKEVIGGVLSPPSRQLKPIRKFFGGKFPRLLIISFRFLYIFPYNDNCA